MAQDEATSVVWGMPGEAVSIGAAEDVLPIEDIAAEIMRAGRRDGRHTNRPAIGAEA